MDIKKKELINKIYIYSFIVLTIILSVLFISFANIIYFTGKNIQKNEDFTYLIYNVETISKYFKYLLIPFILWLLIIIFGIIISYLLPLNKKKKYQSNDIEVYYKLKNKLPEFDENYSDDFKKIYKERKLRMILFIIISILGLLFMIFPARYLFNTDNFSKNETSEAINMAINVFPWIIGAFILFGGYLFFYSNSIKKEIVSIRKILKNKINNQKLIKKDYSLLINIIRVSVLVVGVIFVILGIFNHGYNDVLKKAINICTECIGLA